MTAEAGPRRSAESLMLGWWHNDRAAEGGDEDKLHAVWKKSKNQGAGAAWLKTEVRRGVNVKCRLGLLRVDAPGAHE